jgi:DNA-binding GntR family transcriptional regulator
MTEPVNSTEMAVAGIRAEILSGRLKAGQRLTQAALAERLGTSRFPVREALAILAQQGLVTTTSGQGAAVARLSPDEIEELFGLRVMLEPALADHIIHNISARDVDQFRAFVEEMEEICYTSPARWSELNYKFHAEMYRLSNRPHTTRIVTQLLTLVQPYSKVAVFALGAQRDVLLEHRRLLQSLEHRDAEALSAAISEHVGNAKDNLISVLRRSGRSRQGYEPSASGMQAVPRQGTTRVAESGADGRRGGNPR